MSLCKLINSKTVLNSYLKIGVRPKRTYNLEVGHVAIMLFVLSLFNPWFIPGFIITSIVYLKFKGCF